jgi:hypothetical protein
MTRHPRQPGQNGHANPSLLLTLVHGELAHVEGEEARATAALAALVPLAVVEEPARLTRLCEALEAIDPAPHAKARALAALAAAYARRSHVEEARQALTQAEEAIEPGVPRTPALWAALSRAANDMGEQSWPQSAWHAVLSAMAQRDPVWLGALRELISVHHDSGHDALLHASLATLNPSVAALGAAVRELDVALRALIAQDQLDALDKLWSSIVQRAPELAAGMFHVTGRALAMRGKIGLALAMLDQLEPELQRGAALGLIGLITPLGQAPLVDAVVSWAWRALSGADLAMVLDSAGRPAEALELLWTDATTSPSLLFEVCVAAGALTDAAGLLDQLDEPGAPGDALRKTGDAAFMQAVLGWARGVEDGELRALALASCASALHASGRLREAELLAAEACDAALALPRADRPEVLSGVGVELAACGAPELAAPLLSNPAAKAARDALAATIARGYAAAGDTAGAARCLALMPQGITRLEAAATCYRIVRSAPHTS